MKEERVRSEALNTRGRLHTPATFLAGQWAVKACTKEPWHGKKTGQEFTRARAARRGARARMQAVRAPPGHGLNGPRLRRMQHGARAPFRKEPHHACEGRARGGCVGRGARAAPHAARRPCAAAEEAPRVRCSPVQSGAVRANGWSARRHTRASLGRCAGTDEPCRAAGDGQVNEHLVRASVEQKALRHSQRDHK